MSEYWLDQAKQVAARAVAAENMGDMALVERLDDEYMRCMFNYYDANVSPQDHSGLSADTGEKA